MEVEGCQDRKQKVILCLTLFLQAATYVPTWTCLTAYLSGVVVSGIMRKMPQSLCLDACKQDWWVSVVEWLHSLSWLLLWKTGSSRVPRRFPGLSTTFLQVAYSSSSKGIYYITIKFRTLGWALGWFTRVNQVWSLEGHVARWWRKVSFYCTGEENPGVAGCRKANTSFENGQFFAGLFHTCQAETAALSCPVI